MKLINDLVKEYKPTGYNAKGKVIIVNGKDNKIVVKERINGDVYDYLKSRDFKYYPKIIKNSNKYQLTEYIEEISIPQEQKILDMIDLVSLLHNKTTYYKEIDIDEYKKIYEDISNNIEHLTNYYTDMITIIENNVYPSPSEQVLENNISLVLSSLNYAKDELDNWLKLIETKTKQRLVLLHNNLDLNHYIKADRPYFISWDKATIGIPIFDLYKLYKKYFNIFDFDIIFRRYESKYQMLEEEKKLLFILITLPNKIELNDTEYKNTIKISNMIESINKTNILLNEYSKAKEENKTNK